MLDTREIWLEIQRTEISLELIAILTGYPLVELSIMYDTHIVRGTE